jgi:hypothetical protein
MASHTSTKGPDYDNWSPAQLIQRIKHLESQLPSTGEPQSSISKSKPYILVLQSLTVALPNHLASSTLINILLAISQ